jgi:hypothetical protein
MLNVVMLSVMAPPVGNCKFHGWRKVRELNLAETGRLSLNSLELYLQLLLKVLMKVGIILPACFRGWMHNRKPGDFCKFFHKKNFLEIRYQKTFIRKMI